MRYEIRTWYHLKISRRFPRDKRQWPLRQHDRWSVCLSRFYRIGLESGNNARARFEAYLPVLLIHGSSSSALAERAPTMGRPTTLLRAREGLTLAHGALGSCRTCPETRS